MKQKLYVATLEKIERRYTKQWHSYFKKEFSKDFDVEYINGGEAKEQKIEKGRFLDINKTNEWKAMQVVNISKMFQEDKVKEGDIFFFCDGWSFAITALKYMSQLNNIPVKIYAFWHAGTWDEYDFISQAGLREWAPLVEAGWFVACDGHFVATQFHKDLIVNYFNLPEFDEKLYVVGLPMDFDEELKEQLHQPAKRENLVVFPHRTDPEKRPDIFDKLAKEMPQYKFIKTIEVTKNKQEYYNLIRKAKVTFSASDQETFGIGTVEAMLLGAIPVVPNKLAYTELYDPVFRYNSLDDAKQKIEAAMTKFDGKQKCLKENQDRVRQLCKTSIAKMAEVMKNG